MSKDKDAVVLSYRRYVGVIKSVTEVFSLFTEGVVARAHGGSVGIWAGARGVGGGSYGRPDAEKAPVTLRNLAVASRPLMLPRSMAGLWSRCTLERMLRCSRYSSQLCSMWSRNRLGWLGGIVWPQMQLGSSKSPCSRLNRYR